MLLHLVAKIKCHCQPSQHIGVTYGLSPRQVAHGKRKDECKRAKKGTDEWPICIEPCGVLVASKMPTRNHGNCKTNQLSHTIPTYNGILQQFRPRKRRGLWIWLDTWGSHGCRAMSLEPKAAAADTVLVGFLSIAISLSSSCSTPVILFLCLRACNKLGHELQDLLWLLCTSLSAVELASPSACAM